ncbi:MAG: MMPL family transporter, partial [Myxococcota bacterium]
MRRQLLVLSILFAVAFLAAWFARDLRVDTSVEALLPANSVSVRSIEAARAELPVDEPLTVLIESHDPARNRALAVRVADELAGWPETKWVMTQYGFDSIAERALYYVDLETLDDWNEAAEEALDWEVCEASPVCVTIADPPVLPTSDDVREAVDRAPAGEVLRALTGKSANVDGRGGATTDRLCNDDGSVCAVQALLTGSAGNLGFARRISDRANAFLESLEATQPAGTKIRLVGRYRVAPMEHGIIMHDLRRVSVFAALGSLLVVLFFFRDLRAVVQLAAPMLSGLVVAVGLIVVFGSELNLISASALAILAGMAIDFGIHLLMHARASKTSGRAESHAEAKQSVRQLWVSLVVAGVTTALGFAALSLTRFQGFSQMGWMASLGILVTLAWTLLAFPTVVYWIPSRRELRPTESGSPEGSRGVAIAGLLLAAAAIPAALHLDFEGNLAELQPKVVHHGIDSEVLRARRHVPVLFFGNSSREVSEALNGAAMTTRSQSVLGVAPVVVSAQTLFPENADQKTLALDRLRRTLSRARTKAEEREDADALAEIEALEPWLSIEGPPEPKSLPPWLASILVAPDGTVGERGIAYVPLRGSNAEAMEDLAEWLGDLREAHPGVTFASAEALLGEVTPALIRDAPRILALVFLGLLIATGLASR